MECIILEMPSDSIHSPSPGARRVYMGPSNGIAVVSKFWSKVILDDHAKIGKEIASELSPKAGRTDNRVIKAMVNCKGASMKKGYWVAAYREILDQQK